MLSHCAPEEKSLYELAKSEEKEKDENGERMCSHQKERAKLKMNPVYIPESRFLIPPNGTWLETGNALQPAAST
jgi:hypothetical protein